MRPPRVAIKSGRERKVKGGASLEGEGVTTWPVARAAACRLCPPNRQLTRGKEAQAGKEERHHGHQQQLDAVAKKDG
jgi:hypothetical protein